MARRRAAPPGDNATPERAGAVGPMDTRRHGRPLRPRLLSSPEDEATVSDETGACSAARAALQSAAWRTGALCTPLRPGKANTLRDDDGEENRGVRAEPGVATGWRARQPVPAREVAACLSG